MKKWASGSVMALLAGIYYIFDPTHLALFPKCPFLLLTGLKCPGCGSQRAIHSLLHLDFATAFQYNMLLVSSLPLVTILIYGEIHRKSNPCLYAHIHNVKGMYFYLGVVISWWIVRNIYDI